MMMWEADEALPPWNNFSNVDVALSNRRMEARDEPNFVAEVR